MPKVPTPICPPDDFPSPLLCYGTEQQLRSELRAANEALLKVAVALAESNTTLVKKVTEESVLTKAVGFLATFAATPVGRETISNITDSLTKTAASRAKSVKRKSGSR